MISKVELQVDKENNVSKFFTFAWKHWKIVPEITLYKGNHTEKLKNNNVLVEKEKLKYIYSQAKSWTSSVQDFKSSGKLTKKLRTKDKTGHHLSLLHF